MDDLARVPAQTKAAVIEMVKLTKSRSGWSAERTLRALGVPRSVYYAWRGRESLADRVGRPCRVYEVLAEERERICGFALLHPRIGYRKLTWMMIDADIASVGDRTPTARANLSVFSWARRLNNRVALLAPREREALAEQDSKLIHRALPVERRSDRFRQYVA